jgi:hypothetical protein
VGSNNKKLTLEEVVKRAVEIHGDAYDYSKAVYKNYDTKIEIICRTTGNSFFATPINHIHGRTRCPCCYGTIKRTTSTFAEKAKEIWGEKFDYSKVEYVNNTTKVWIRCIEHNTLFTQTPKHHLRGQNGCQACTNKTPITTKSFIDFAKAVHGDKYDYSLCNYTGTERKVQIICKTKFANSDKTHGVFEQSPHNHISLHQDCPICARTKSKPEVELTDILNGFELQYRAKILGGKREIDIYLPSLKIGIEYNGLYWHSENRVGKWHHANKTDECAKLGVKLIHIFEDEWLEKRQIVESRLRSITGTDTKIYARTTSSKEINWKTAKEFLDKKHIQGAGMPTGKNLGLYSKSDDLVAVMTFSELRFEESIDGHYELVRFCSEGTVVGGFSKLLKKFVSDYLPKRIISYSDRRWSTGSVYSKNGFTHVSTTDPGYWWVKGKNRYSRVLFQKHKLANRLEKFDETLTEEQNCILNGYSKVWDCGHDKWELNL